MKKTVFILVDAFRHDYLDRGLTPFLDKEKTNGEYTKRIKPGHGFCERAEIFTGKKPSETGFFTAIDLKKDNNIYSRFSWLLHIIDYILKICSSNFINKVTRRVIWELVSRTKYPMHPYRIPLNMLKNFSLTEDYVDMRNTNALGFESIFDYLNKNNLKYFYDSFTALNLVQNGNDQDRLNLVLDNAKDDSSLYFIYLGAADAVGHKYGTQSVEINTTIQEIDKKLEIFVNKFNKINPETKYIFLGDHGMIDIEVVVNTQEIINQIMSKNKYKSGVDFEFFLDSTLMRIWIKDSNRKEKIIESFLNVELLNVNGTFLSYETAKNFDIPFDETSADIMWWANPGVLISPDFFHTKKEIKKGMHGYLNTHGDSHGFCITSGVNIKPSRIESEDLISVFSKLK